MHLFRLFLLLALFSPYLSATQPDFDPLASGSSDHSVWAELKQKNILSWTTEEMKRGYPNIRHINPVREIPPASTPYVVAEAPWPVNDNITKAMIDLHLAGLLIIHQGQIRYESYREGHTKDQRWMSFSITKSVVSLLYGIALEEGHIKSLDDTVADYLPQFENAAYGQVSLRHLLQMASGIAWNEDYEDPNSDVAKLDRADEAAVLEHLATLPKVHEPGEVFNYNTGETILAGVVLSKAVNTSLSEYLSTRLWSVSGMADGADWALMGEGGSEMGGCCISATLRDYARIGLAVLANLKGKATPAGLPAGWMAQATTPSPSAPFYGYFWWLDGPGEIRASGIFGQGIYISKDHDLVIAMHGLWPRASDATLQARRDDFIEMIKQRALSAP